MIVYDPGKCPVNADTVIRNANCQGPVKKRMKYRPYAGIWMENAEIILYGWFDEDSVITNN